MADNTWLQDITKAKKEGPSHTGLPGWMATFADLVTLLLTFFVLLLSFAKTESSKYEEALGSIRNTFGGNVMQEGDVIKQGTSPDDSNTFLDSEEPIRPFPIEYLSTENFLDKHEINRHSTENLKEMTKDLQQFDLLANSDIYETKEGVKVIIKDKIYFKKGSLTPDKISIPVYDKLVQMLTQTNWIILVAGHAAKGESSQDGTLDALGLSSARAMAVTQSLLKRGMRADKVTTVFYGDARSIEKQQNDKAGNNLMSSGRVEFIIRKNDLLTPGMPAR